VSPKGGIYLSVILRPKVSPEDALRLTLMTAVAVAQSIRRTLSLSAEIKWPNDVLVDGKKVCGILTEMKTSGKTVDFVTVGIGINANVDTRFLPAHLRTSTTSLMQELGEEAELENLLRALLEELEHYYKLFTRGESSLILEEWRRLAGFLGSHVKVVDHGEETVGLAVDVDQSGALLIKTHAGHVRRVASGDVTSMREVKH
jgi:BirA family biotin operon repressor/biotin-[acetyl-CoA-carboxylase] ligase